MTKLMDLKDKKLLYHLSQNARQSDTQLAKSIGLSKNSIKYRIKRLKTEHIIKNFTCVIDIGKLKLDTFLMFLKFNEDIYEKPEIIEYFKQHKFTDWVATTSGHWDIMAEFVYKDLNHAYSLINDIIGKFSSSLSSYESFLSHDIIKVEHLIPDFYKGLGLPKKQLQKKESKEYKLDNIDKKILALLSKDSSLSYFTIAENLGITIDIVRYRIKNLIESNIILQFFPEISLPKLGYSGYLYSIKLRNLKPEELTKIKKAIEADSNITYGFFDITSLSIVFVCAFKSVEEIDSLSRSLRKQFFNIIEDQDFMLIKEQIKFNLYPEGLLEI